MLKEQNNSIKAFKLGFQLSKVKSPQEEKKEMKYTLAFHAEGKNLAYKVFYLQCQFFPFVWQFTVL